MLPIDLLSQHQGNKVKGGTYSNGIFKTSLRSVSKRFDELGIGSCILFLFISESIFVYPIYLFEVPRTFRVHKFQYT